MIVAYYILFCDVKHYHSPVKKEVLLIERKLAQGIQYRLFQCYYLQKKHNPLLSLMQSQKYHQMESHQLLLLTQIAIIILFSPILMKNVIVKSQHYLFE